jgi:hypothetical protein
MAQRDRELIRVGTNKMAQPDSASVSDGVYARRFVGFVDILGFEAIVVAADQSPPIRSRVIRALRQVRLTRPPQPVDTDLRVQNFSDSLIVSARDTADGLWHLIFSLDALAWNLLQDDILVRGGIALGGVHHDNEVVFGVGINKAYRLESRVARYPRIVLSGEVLMEADRYASQDDAWSVFRQSRLLRDADGVYFVNYLNDLASANQFPRTGINPDPWREAGSIVREHIQRRIDSTMDAPDIYEKVLWLARYWNRVVPTAAFTPEQSAFEPIRLAGEEPRGIFLPFRTL